MNQERYACSLPTGSSTHCSCLAHVPSAKDCTEQSEGLLLKGMPVCVVVKEILLVMANFMQHVTCRHYVTCPCCRRSCACSFFTHQRHPSLPNHLWPSELPALHASPALLAVHALLYVHLPLIQTVIVA